ncbi:DHHW family protein [uncultured Ruminococcus sp.]|uniref:DHHW family protein n=1 Tax=uncultured Ruminococcus sp. TaxID=165186 RepID=UPI0025DF6708|nr:DHHW family protein [uncultured Ruminococcus sp.]
MKIKIFAACSAAMLMLTGCGNTIGQNKDMVVDPKPKTTEAVPTVDEDSAESEKPEEPTESTAEDDKKDEKKTSKVTTTKAPETTTKPVTTTAKPEEGTYEYFNGCILANSDTSNVRAMEEYYYNSENGRYLADCVDVYADSVGSNVNTYLMMIPTSQEFYIPDDLRDSYPDQKECADEVYSMMTSGKSVPINSTLEDHKGEYLYSRSDYHWQPLAAYYASKVFAEKAGVDFSSLDSYEKVEREGYLGAFYSVNGIYPLEESPDTFTYYKPANLDSLNVLFHDTYFGEGVPSSLFFEDNDISASYTVFVGTDDTILEVDTDADNDRVLVIFKDSYGNALVPFLTSSFSKIYLCDNRFFNINSVDFAKEVGATDVLFALGAASSSSYDKISLIESNMNQ